MNLRAAAAASVLFACALCPALTRAADTIGSGAIIASVRDGLGHPVAGAAVGALGPAERHATTTLAGIVTLAALPMGSYRVRVTCAGYEAVETTATLRGAQNFTLVNVRLDRTDSQTSPSVMTSAPAHVAIAGRDPSLVHALAGAPLRFGTSGLLGAAANETAVTLDGLPLGGPSLGPDALRPDALVVDRAALLTGSETIAPSLDGAVGGVLDLRTAASFAPRAAQALAGYDSQFGSFQRLDGDILGARFGASLLGIVGGGIERDQIVHARDALSSATTLEADAYSLQRDASPLTNAAHDGLGDVRLQTRALGGTFAARAYASDYAGSVASESKRGVAAGYERLLGTTSFDLTADRHSDAVTSLAGLANPLYSNLGASVGLPLGNGGRFVVGDAYATGGGVRGMWLPRAGFALPTGTGWTLHASAASAYLTPPFELTSVTPSAASLTPETSFAYRAGADVALPNGGTLSFDEFAVTRWNRFATLADARSSGFEMGYTRQPQSVGFGVTAGIAFARDSAFGAAQPAQRVVPAIYPGDLNGDGSARARLGFTFLSASGLQWHAGALALGPDNGYSDRALQYADFGVTVPFLRRFALQIDGATPLGSLAPRTLTLSLGAAAAPK